MKGAHCSRSSHNSHMQKPRRQESNRLPNSWTKAPPSFDRTAASVLNRSIIAAKH